MAWTLDALRAYPVSGRRPARLEGGWDNETAARNPNRKGAPREVVLANLNGHQKQVPHGRPGVDWEWALSGEKSCGEIGSPQDPAENRF
jgi:hypothetical protein